MSSSESESSGSPTLPPTPAAKEEIEITTPLADLQTDEQRRVLDIMSQVRKCGLDGLLELPRLVVCGDQSAGKSSVLEALTEIPFPRNDNLCTRFATEISLRRANTNSLTIKVIPDETLSTSEQATIKEFEESITNFDDFPRVMNLAMAVIGIDAKPESESAPRAFARDLTLVDIPGLIATHNKGTTSADVALVAEITDRYISQHRTICLAVVSATSDYANRKILEKVRAVDPKGERTLGIITKPDRLDAGSGSEQAFIQLATNEDIYFEVGWHVLKNRSYDKRDSELNERNLAEDMFFRTSNFKVLSPESRGIDALRRRLAQTQFWEQSSKWGDMANAHVEEVSKVCSKFLRILLQDKCPEDVQTRIWGAKIENALRKRTQNAYKELDLLMEDLTNYPINYNHYYTDTIAKRRQERLKDALKTSIEDASNRALSFGTPSHVATVDADKAVTTYLQKIDPNMENVSCEEALDCLLAMYKVQQKTFVANVTTQVIERHIVRGLEQIFSPVVVSALTDAEALAIASEPVSSINKRKILEDQIAKLEAGKEIFSSVL